MRYGTPAEIRRGGRAPPHASVPAAAAAAATQGCCRPTGCASPPPSRCLPQPCNTTFFDAISGADSDTGLFEQGLSLAGAKDKLPDPNALPVRRSKWQMVSLPAARAVGLCSWICGNAKAPVVQLNVALFEGASTQCPFML